MRRLKCLFRKHQWYRSQYNPETEETVWECRRCGATKSSTMDPAVRGIFWGLG